MKAILCTHNHKIPVELAQDTSGLIMVIRESDNKTLFYFEPKEEKRPALVPQQPKEWVFGSDDLPENINPLDYPKVTIADLNGKTDQEKWQLLVHRFPWLFAKDFEYKHAVKYAEQVSKDGPTAMGKNQLEIDLEKVLPHLAEITNPDGSLNGSKIARILGGEGARNAGTLYHRIQPLIKELEARRAA